MTAPLNFPLSRRRFLASGGLVTTATRLAPRRLLAADGLVERARKSGTTASITVQKLRGDVSVLPGLRRKYRSAFGQRWKTSHRRRRCRLAAQDCRCARGHRPRSHQLVTVREQDRGPQEAGQVPRRNCRCQADRCLRREMGWWLRGARQIYRAGLPRRFAYKLCSPSEPRSAMVRVDSRAGAR